MSSQYYVYQANAALDEAANDPQGRAYHIGRSQTLATLSLAASIHDLISHLRGVTPCRPFETEETTKP